MAWKSSPKYHEVKNKHQNHLSASHHFCLVPPAMQPPRTTFTINPHTIISSPVQNFLLLYLINESSTSFWESVAECFHCTQAASRLVLTSLAWPDPFRAAAYRLEIISAALQGSEVVNEHKNFKHVIGVNYFPVAFLQPILKSGITWANLHSPTTVAIILMILYSYHNISSTI